MRLDYESQVYPMLQDYAEQERQVHQNPYQIRDPVYLVRCCRGRQRRPLNFHFRRHAGIEVERVQVV